MAMQRSFLSLVFVGLVFGGMSGANAQDDEAPASDEELQARQMEIDTRSQTALDELLESNEGANSLFEQAAGYAVFDVTKAGGFLVTGAGGSGVVVNKATGDRIYMRMGSGGVGFGIGAQQYDLVIMFEDVPHLDRFMDGGWDSSATAQAAAGQEGINLTSSFIDGVAFFQITDKGLIAIADVAGTRFWVADTLN
jgi:lipid-binding SYLF domain-containing protein